MDATEKAILERYQQLLINILEFNERLNFQYNSFTSEHKYQKARLAAMRHAAQIIEKNLINEIHRFIGIGEI